MTLPTLVSALGLLLAASAFVNYLYMRRTNQRLAQLERDMDQYKRGLI